MLRIFEASRTPHVGNTQPVRKWSYNGVIYFANTRSEARAMIKKEFGLRSLNTRLNELKEVK